MDKAVLQENLEIAYAEQAQATKRYRKQAEVVRKASQELEFAKMSIRAKGLVEGKNVAEREANEFKLFETDAKALEEEKQLEAEAYLEKELADIKVAYVRSMLRLMELIDERE